jgi:hypothetical protein
MTGTYSHNKSLYFEEKIFYYFYGMAISENLEVTAYVEACDISCKSDVLMLRNLLLTNLPDGFEEGISYGIPTYSVPHSIYPKGYHCKPAIPLPFISFACRKKEIVLYHMGLYADTLWMEEFIKKYTAIVGKAPDVGKSCIRFKKTIALPEPLLKETFQKMNPQEWIKCYEQVFRK